MAVERTCSEILPPCGDHGGICRIEGQELFQQVALNTARADLINGRYVFPAGARRPNPAFDVNLQSPQNIGESWYHSFQVELQRSLSSGWQMGLAYTRSRSEDTASAYTPTFEGGGANGSGYVYDIMMGKSLSSFHVGQRISANGVWQLPFGKDRKFGANWSALTDAILGGWQLSGIVQIADGTPIEISIGARSDQPPSVWSLTGRTGPGGDQPGHRRSGSFRRYSVCVPGVANHRQPWAEHAHYGRSCERGHRFVKELRNGSRTARAVPLRGFQSAEPPESRHPDTTVFNNRGVRQASAGSSRTRRRRPADSVGLRHDW